LDHLPCGESGAYVQVKVTENHPSTGRTSRDGRVVGAVGGSLVGSVVLGTVGTVDVANVVSVGTGAPLGAGVVHAVNTNATITAPKEPGSLIRSLNPLSAGQRDAPTQMRRRPLGVRAGRSRPVSPHWCHVGAACFDGSHRNGVGGPWCAPRTGCRRSRQPAPAGCTSW